MVLNSYDSVAGSIIFSRLPPRTSTGPPPIAVFAPRKLGDEPVESVNTAPVATIGTPGINAGPIDRTMIPGANCVDPDS